MPARVALIGLDACDPGIARELMAEGRMPNLAALAERGQRRAVVPPHGLFVGAIWPSIATGCGPGTHGIYSWRQFVPGSYATKRMEPAESGARPMWEALSQAGANVAVVDVPLSAPAQELNGMQIVDWGSHDRWMAPTSVGADEFLHDRPGHPIGVRCDHSARTTSPGELLETLLAGARAKGQLSLDVLRSGDWDLFVTVFAESHCAGHHLWKYHDADHVDHDPDADHFSGDPLHEVYAELDVQVGRLLDELDDDTQVLLLLSHGFVPHYGGEHVFNDALLRIEQSIAPTPTLRAVSGATRRVGHWVTKRAKARLGHGDPTLASLDGARAFFQVPNNERFGGIRFNVAGREPQGFIEPGTAAGRELIERLEHELYELRCPTTGRQLVTDVISVDEHHPGPRRDHLPDLLVDWDWSAPIEKAASPTIGVVTGHYSGLRTGDHRPIGEVISSTNADNRVADAGSGAVRTEDLAPTIAAVLGQELAGVDGSVIDGFVGSGR